MNVIEKSKEITKLKTEIKDSMRNNVSNTYKLQWLLIKKKSEFRHEHIAYSISLGNEYIDIENKVKIGNEPNWTLINSILKEKYNIPEGYKNA